MHLQSGDRVVFIGDSITDAGRPKPVAEAPADLGQGYVSQVYSLLSAACPEVGLRVWNCGISGDNVRALRMRWQTDVFDLQPDWLSVMIGINDVWRHFDNPLRDEWHVSLEEYRGTLGELVASTRSRVKGLILMTPYYLETDLSNPMRRQMDAYGQAALEIAAAHDCIAVNTQTHFDSYLAHRYPDTISADRVHMNPSGHMILTRAWLQAVEFSW